MKSRAASIDLLRALTMLLMIFVNDLWTLKNIPEWLGHTAADTDGMGLADIIFPAFLLIVGLSIPYALTARIQKGYSKKQTLVYILSRSLALLVMGFFHVNLESYDPANIISKPVWQIAVTISFFLIWLDYSPAIKKITKTVLQVTGILLLVSMAAFYRDESGDWMQARWWGILGLIGWAYLLSAIVFLFSNGRLAVSIIAFTFFLMFNIAANSEWGSFLNPMKKYIWIAGGGSMPALTMAGVIIGSLYRKHQKSAKFFSIAVFTAVCFLVLGFILRQHFIISKIRATPSWTLISAAITIFSLILFIWLIGIKNKGSWLQVIRPAGTSTLTCYLLPYIHYAIYSLVAISLPESLRTGVIGLLKSMLYALAIVFVTGLLEKQRLRLKV